MRLLEITKKYDELAVNDCCSSNGNALKYMDENSGESVIHLRKEDEGSFNSGIFMQYSTESADRILADCVLHQVSDKQKVWNEIYRVLKKGGRFIVSDLYAEETGQPKPACHPVTRHEYLNLLEKAGFSVLTIYEESPLSSKEEGSVASWILSGEKPLAECDWCV